MAARSDRRGVVELVLGRSSANPHMVAQVNLAEHRSCGLPRRAMWE